MLEVPRLEAFALIAIAGVLRAARGLLAAALLVAAPLGRVAVNGLAGVSSLWCVAILGGAFGATAEPALRDCAGIVVAVVLRAHKKPKETCR